MELSICLADAELTALAAVLGESLPTLGPSTLDGLTAAVRADRRTDALDSLRRRGVVVTTPGGATEVAVSVARLVEILCRPAIVVDVYAGDARWPAHPRRLSAVALAGVDAERIDDGLRLTPFATSDLLLRAAVVSGLTADVHPGARAVTVDGRALARALRAGTPARTLSELDVGLVGDDRDLLTALATAVTGRRTALKVRGRSAGGRGGGLEMAWVAGPAGAWEIPVAATPLASTSTADQDGSLPARPVVLSPVDEAGLLAVLTTLADDETPAQGPPTRPRREGRALV